MHLFFERTVNARSDCPVLSVTWMGKVPDEFPEARSEDDPWKLNRKNYYQEGWLATGNVRGIVGITFTTSHCKKNFDFPIRTNYNLRGHRSEVILVKWNEPYQKLASCDSSGIIFVWIKYEGRWSIELINDRNTPVTHFSWSHDGRMALICYQDGFVLVGSVAGQRYWSSMLNLDSTITCGIWTPNDNQVYFGTSSGQIVVMDVHGAMVSQVQLGRDVGITSMAWSCEKFKMEEGQLEEEFFFGQAPETDERNFVLAVAMQNGHVYLLKTFDDVAPVEINTELQGPLCMEWSSSRECLAIAGITLKSPAIGDYIQYTNMLKFYNEKGVLLYQARIPDQHARVSSITWGHNDLRLFLATGTQVHIAWVVKSIPSLQLLSRIRVHNLIPNESILTYLPIPRRLRNSVGNLFAQTIRCYVPEPSRIRDFVARPPTGSVRLHCTMIRHDDENNLSSGTCYTLYLEYLGGLVPLLKGKRTSQLRPDFVIFDPQAEDGHHSSSSSSDSRISYSAATAGIFTDSSDSDRVDDGCAGSPKIQRIKKLQRRRKRRQRAQQEHIHQRAQFNRLEQDLDAEDLCYVDTLPEQDKLVEVTSNIWGTKFKMHGLASSVPANLGQVTYKTSLLHLQPRQMTLVITELRDDFPIGPDPTFNPNLFSEDEEEVPNEDKKPLRINMDNCLPIAPMSPRTSVLSRQKTYLNEDGIDVIEPREIKEEGCQIRPQQLRPSSTQNTSFIGQLGKNCPQNQKHAISPIYCDVSLPALQSPKNAVSPSDIIFDRPPATYSNNSATLQVKSQPQSDSSVSTECSTSSSSKSSSLIRKNTEKIPSTGEKELKPTEDDVGPSTSRTKSANPVPAVIEPMMRSCSVGYLDMVDAQLVPNEVRLSMLRKDIPKRLVLVNNDTTENRKRQSRLRSKPCSKNKNFAKSKSLDSSDIFHNESNTISSFAVKENTLPEVIEQEQEQEVKKNIKNTSRRELFSSPLMGRRNKADKNSRSINNNNENGERNGISIHTQALANLEKLISRLRDDDGRPTPPPSPRLPRSSPSSPAPTKKGARPQSASPIRRKLLSSPLLGRRYKKQKNQESSDDEVNASGDEIFNGTNYKDLETFQKSQLRQKLKRGKIEPNGSCCNNQVIPQRREFVMHNKAPMWNENSQVYQLDFGGRVTQESAKNFQIEFRGKQVMQFGRIDGNAYTLDFQYPFSALQAFAVALANVTQRLK